MAMHAKSGGNIEIMGMLQGKVVGDNFVVLDAFALPVEGTETRVNAQAEAYEFMIDFFESNKVMSASCFQSELIAHTCTELVSKSHTGLMRISLTEIFLRRNDVFEKSIDLFFIALQTVGRLENMVGWYHSHPGYGCWLSGIDVGTQMTQQQYLDPFLAIVVDPHRTIAAGKVEIGAFRTYPQVKPLGFASVSLTSLSIFSNCK